jgi:hypothetical protein
MLKMFQQCAGSFCQLLLKTDFQQSYPAVSVLSLKLFEISISLESPYAAARALCLCRAKSESLNMGDDSYSLSPFLETSI